LLSRRIQFSVFLVTFIKERAATLTCGAAEECAVGYVVAVYPVDALSNMRRYKILMLGWNDVALSHGGIGVACQGLCRALDATDEITLIVPTAKGLDVEKAQIITTEAGVKADQPGYAGVAPASDDDSPVPATEKGERQHTIVELPIALDPYYFTRQDSTLVREVQEQKARAHTAGDGGKLSEEIRPDKDDVLERVMEYARRVSEIAQGLDFDIIHAHDWMTFLAGIYVKNLTGKPLVLHVHSLDYDRTGTGSKTWVFNIERYALSKADMVISVSEYTSGIIFSRYGLSSKKVVVVHNGVQPLKGYRIPAADGAGKTVLFVGRITGQKGPKYFLQVARKVAELYNDVRFVMVGVGDELQEIQETGEYLHMAGKVELRGFLPHEELQKAYAAADVLCLPSVSEPFGLVALEAAQFGVPVVLSTRAGVGEVLQSALKANYWDIDLMANHVVALMTDSKLRKRKVNQGLKEIKSATWPRAAAKVRKVYDGLLNG
jgi:glycosyltransferase involved in cell wall biosynthesis